MCISTLQRLTKYPGQWTKLESYQDSQGLTERWRQEKILKAQRETQYESGVRMTSYILAVALETRRAMPSKAWTKIIFNLESDVWPYHPSNFTVEEWCLPLVEDIPPKWEVSQDKVGDEAGDLTSEKGRVSPGCQRMTIPKQAQLCCNLPGADPSRLEQIRRLQGRL